MADNHSIGHVTLAAIAVTAIQMAHLQVKSLQLTVLYLYLCVAILQFHWLNEHHVSKGYHVDRLSKGSQAKRPVVTDITYMSLYRGRQFQEMLQSNKIKQYFDGHMNVKPYNVISD